MKRDMLNRGVYLVLLLALLASCKAKKAIVSTPVPKIDSASVAVESPSSNSANTGGARADKLTSVKNKQAAFKTLSAKAKAALSIGSNSNDVTMNIRIKNNEAIWVSVTAIAGLEVARALITPDSVRVINRLENEYLTKPFSYLYEFTNNKINFGTLQSVLVGNIIPEFISDSTEVSIKEGQTELKSTITSLIYTVIVNGQDKVTGTNLNDAAAGQSLVVTYGSFQPVLQQQLPHSIVMRSQAKNKKISLDLNFTKIELDAPIDTPFRVPERFTIKK